MPGSSPQPPGRAAGTAPEPATDQAEEDAPQAKVIPMGIFDPFAEADKRW